MGRCITVAVAALAVLLSVGVGWGEESTAVLTEKLFKDLDESQTLGFARMSAAVASPDGQDESVQWPTFTSPKPMFGRINLGPESNLSFAMDRSSGSQGAYDLLYIDLNMDKQFGDGERLLGHNSPEAEMVAGSGAIDFGTVEVAQPNLHLHLWSATSLLEEVSGSGGAETAGGGGLSIIEYSPWSYFEGDVRIGDTDQTIRLFDQDMDGKVSGYGVDMLVMGDGPPMPLSRVIQHGDQLLAVTVSADSQKITVGPYTGPKGRVSISIARDSGAECEISGWLTSGAGMALPFAAAENEFVELPAGDYVMAYASIECQADTRIWTTCFFNHMVSVAGGTDSTIRLGKPMALDMTVAGEPRPGEAAAIQCRLRGAAGEGYESFASFGVEEGTYVSGAPKVVVRDGAGRVVQEETVDTGGGEMRYSWSVPESAQSGDRYTIEVTVDTGPFAGKISGSKTLTVQAPATDEG